MVPAMQAILVKRYDGRRLYDTEMGRYVTLGSIADLVREGSTVVIRDARTGEDVTSAVLTKLIAGNA